MQLYTIVLTHVKSHPNPGCRDIKVAKTKKVCEMWTNHRAACFLSVYNVKNLLYTESRVHA